MLCRCTSSSLRLFIRSVAQVDVPASAKCLPLSSPSIRSSRPAFGAHASFPRRPFSSTACSFDSQASAEKPLHVDSQDGIVQEAESGDKLTQDSKGTKDESAFVEFSLDAIDEILAESRAEKPISNGPADTVVVDDGTPASFVATSFSKQRDLRERKAKQRDMVWRPLEEGGNSSFRELQVNKEQRRDSATARPEAEDQHYSTFPRLPRINREVTEATPLKSRIPKDNQNPGGRREWVPQDREHWQIDKESRIKKYPEGWNPQKRLSPDAISGIRALHAQLPEEYHTRKLAETFQVSPEAISRILRTHWAPNAEEEADRTRRWLKRGESVWTRYAELGVKPPKKWREAGIGNGKPEWVTIKKVKGKAVGHEPGPGPALVTLPRRPGGSYQVGGKRKPSDEDGGGFI